MLVPRIFLQGPRLKLLVAQHFLLETEQKLRIGMTKLRRRRFRHQRHGIICRRHRKNCSRLDNRPGFPSPSPRFSVSARARRAT